MTVTLTSAKLSREREAANAYTAEQNYGGSAEALAIAEAFETAAAVAGSASDRTLISAFIAGLGWAEADKARQKAILEALTSRNS